MTVDHMNGSCDHTCERGYGEDERLRLELMVHDPMSIDGRLPSGDLKVPMRRYMCVAVDGPHLREELHVGVVEVPN